MADDTAPRPQTKPSPQRAGGWRTFWRRRWRADRNRFSRESIKDGLKTFAWVAPLTLLIWVYAERKQVEDLNDQTIPIALVSTNPTHMARLAGRDANITADLRGSRTALDKLKRELSSASGPRRLSLEVRSEHLATGQTHLLRADSLLADNPIVKDNLIEVLNVSPPTLNVEIDERVTHEIPIRAPLNITNLDGAPVFSPATIIFTGPRSVWENAVRDQTTYAYADLSGFIELRTPGTHELKSVSITNPWQDDGVTLAPDKVDVTIGVRQADETFEISSLSVFVTVPQTFQGRYRVEYPATIARIRVSGPPEVIRAIESNLVRPKARLEVSADDLPAGRRHSRQLLFDLPQGVKVVSDASQTTVDFVIQEARPTD